MLVGDSQVMQQLRARIQRVAVTSFTVLIEGESGAGKELVAREIHAASDRRRGPFVAVNCAALVETLIEAELFGIEERTATGVRGRRGKFEMADDGTLFLDEVADLSPTSQAKLLRVLQDRVVERVGATSSRSVNTRVIAATNQTLRSQVDAGRFRTDLYYRLAGVEVTVPPLRARRGDVPLLVDHFLRVHQRGELMRVADSALDALRTYDWPGNVRQLERVIERAIALAAGRDVTLADLPAEVSREYAALVAPARNDTLRAWSSRYARFVLERTGGNKRRACDVLDISYQTLRALLSYGAVAERPPASSDAGLADEPVHAAFTATPAVEPGGEQRQPALWDAWSGDPTEGTER